MNSAGAYSNWRYKARTEPLEAQEIWSARLESAQQDYLAGRIGRDTFGLLLYNLGFRNSDLSAELTYWDDQKAQKSLGQRFDRS